MAKNKIYPECEKVRAAAEESQIAGDFLDWLETSKGLTLAYIEGYTWRPNRQSIESLLAEYHKIDLKKVELERREIIANLREVENGK